MQLQPTPLPGAYVLEAERQEDERGTFMRLWDAPVLQAHGLDAPLTLLCASWNPKRGTLRGLHWQQAPHEETKLVRCTRGRIYDVAVDVRSLSSGSPAWYGVELAAGDGRALYLSGGLAHGFLTLENDTEVQYLMTNSFEPRAARGLRYDDPALAIDWPAEVVLVSDRDRTFPLLP